MAGNGGRRPGAGRPKGVRNKISSKIKASIGELAQQYTAAAIETLAEVMTDISAPPAARINAANALLDRGHGRPKQAVDHTSSDGSLAPITGFEIRIADAPDRDVDQAAG